MNKSIDKSKPSFFKRVVETVKGWYDFVMHRMWRIRTDDGSFRSRKINFLKVIYISIAEYIDNNIYQKASALTFTTILSFVPILAILLSMAAAFGVKDSVRDALFRYAPAHESELSKALNFAQSYMDSIHGGIFIGIGILFLLYTVIMLLGAIEDTFNDIWHISQYRSWGKRIPGYLTAFVILPVALTLSGGMTVFVASLEGTDVGGIINLGSVAMILLKVIPFVIIVLIFSFLYVILPNTKVSLYSGFIAGITTGVALQLFQMLYISGQLWVSRYNSIYGSFAAIPLLLLFLQASWQICLFGANLTYAIDNIESFTFKQHSAHISRRYRDFVAVILMEKICKAFQHNHPPYSAQSLAEATHLPRVIVSDTLMKLLYTDLVIEHPVEGDSYNPIYLPAMDIHQLSVGRVITSLDRLGLEEFNFDLEQKYANEWETIVSSRKGNEVVAERLLIDL